LLANLSEDAIAGRIAEKIRRDIGQSYSIDGIQIQVGASVGLAVYPYDGERHATLLQHADAAMFRDKVVRRAATSLCEIESNASAPGREQPAMNRAFG